MAVTDVMQIVELPVFQLEGKNRVDYRIQTDGYLVSEIVVVVHGADGAVLEESPAFGVGAACVLARTLAKMYGVAEITRSQR